MKKKTPFWCSKKMFSKHFGLILRFYGVLLSRNLGKVEKTAPQFSKAIFKEAWKSMAGNTGPKMISGINTMDSTRITRRMDMANWKRGINGIQVNSKMVIGMGLFIPGSITMCSIKISKKDNQNSEKMPNNSSMP